MKIRVGFVSNSSSSSFVLKSLPELGHPYNVDFWKTLLFADQGLEAEITSNEYGGDKNAFTVREITKLLSEKSHGLNNEQYLRDYVVEGYLVPAGNKELLDAATAHLMTKIGSAEQYWVLRLSSESEDELERFTLHMIDEQGWLDKYYIQRVR